MEKTAQWKVLCDLMGNATHPADMWNLTQCSASRRRNTWTVNKWNCDSWSRVGGGVTAYVPMCGWWVMIGPLRLIVFLIHVLFPAITTYQQLFTKSLCFHTHPTMFGSSSGMILLMMMVEISVHTLEMGILSNNELEGEELRNTWS